jgi:hypothetical protein
VIAREIVHGLLRSYVITNVLDSVTINEPVLLVNGLFRSRCDTMVSTHTATTVPKR